MADMPMRNACSQWRSPYTDIDSWICKTNCVCLKILNNKTDTLLDIIGIALHSGIVSLSPAELIPRLFTVSVKQLDMEAKQNYDTRQIASISTVWIKYQSIFFANLFMGTENVSLPPDDPFRIMIIKIIIKW